MPCDSSPVGMTCNIIEHGIAGSLDRNTEEWLAHIDTLLKDPSLGRRLAACGLERICQQYSLDVHAPRLVKVFRKVISASFQT